MRLLSLISILVVFVLYAITELAWAVVATKALGIVTLIAAIVIALDVWSGYAKKA